jgi:cysteine synthase
MVTNHPSAVYEMARLRHAEAVSAADRRARGRGYGAGEDAGGEVVVLARLARLVRRRRRVAVAPAAQGLPAAARGAPAAPTAR